MTLRHQSPWKTTGSSHRQDRIFGLPSLDIETVIINGDWAALLEMRIDEKGSWRRRMS
jgi:hypothetical protein